MDFDLQKSISEARRIAADQFAAALRPPYQVRRPGGWVLRRNPRPEYPGIEGGPPESWLGRWVKRIRAQR